MANAIANHKRGDTWNGMVLTLKKLLVPVNLMGFTAICRFKTSPNSSVAFEFNTSDGTLIIPIGTDGKIHFIGRKMDVPAARYVFDIELTSPGGVVTTIMEGTWEITQDIT